MTLSKTCHITMTFLRNALKREYLRREIFMTLESLFYDSII